MNLTEDLQQENLKLKRELAEVKTGWQNDILKLTDREIECGKLRAALIEAQRDAQYNLESLSDEVGRKMELKNECARLRAELAEAREERKNMVYNYNQELAKLRALCANVKSMMEATAKNFHHNIGDQCGCWICICIRDLNAAAGRGEGER